MVLRGEDMQCWDTRLGRKATIIAVEPSARVGGATRVCGGHEVEMLPRGNGSDVLRMV